MKKKYLFWIKYRLISTQTVCVMADTKKEAFKAVRENDNSLVDYIFNDVDRILPSTMEVTDKEPNDLRPYEE